ncbi:response regulator [Nocardioides marmorisolisilvae]|uniref:Response regulator n=1 Tax=Nocardioides marmorisolisilvae TaxID=1542737 RepID=A0A3N0DV35_9ACTN|nr:response regulator [Nocardioides marmorisolisilvae]
MAEPAVVTVLFTDIVASTEAFQRLGDEAASRAHADHLDEMSALVDQFDGRVVKSMGDGVMSVFASANQAVQCAVRMQQEVAAADDGIEIRVGLDCGEPVERDGDYFGNPVIVAKRLCDLCDPGQILSTTTVLTVAGSRLNDVRLSSLGPVAVKGLENPVETTEVLWNTEVGTGKSQFTVVVVDDQKLLRAGFSVILRAERDLTVVGEASDGLEAIEVVRERRPDVVVMDVRMPNMDGLEAARQILGEFPETRVLMLTTFDLDEYVYEAIRAGASGFLLKDVPGEQLVDAVRTIARGESIIDPAVTRRMIEQFAKPPAAPETPAFDVLTAREADILKLLARGLSNAEIATELFVEETTVKTHVGKVLHKLGLRDRVQAVVFAYESGFLAQ